MIKIYTQPNRAQQWLNRYRHKRPIFACVLGFTETGLIPNISAAGATPESRKYTAVADAEFLINGASKQVTYPLPPLTVGISPVFITRAVVQSLEIPVYLFDAGLSVPPAVAAIPLGGKPANCLSGGFAMPLDIVKRLLAQGEYWGEILAKQAGNGYVIISECVVGGTTTALALLTGLGIPAFGKVNSSHPQCNHQQKWSIVQAGLQNAGFLPLLPEVDPLELVSAIGDPMQIVAAAMALVASRYTGVMLAGGTQMLAVYALMLSLLNNFKKPGNLDQIVVGTTGWVAEDPTGDTVGLAEAIGCVPILAAQLNFAPSVYPSLQAYQQGYVKEGVGAGGCAIAANLYQNWSDQDLLGAVEAVASQFLSLNPIG